MSVYLIMHHAKQTCEGLEVKLHAFLTWALDGVSGQLHAPSSLPAGK